jgi:hypothetical protein
MGDRISDPLRRFLVGEHPGPVFTDRLRRAWFRASLRMALYAAEDYAREKR